MKKLIEHLVMLILGIVSGAYMLNLTFGFDLLPDNMPVVGNLDEAAAMTLLLSVLSYFGLDLTRYFRKRGKPGKEEGPVIDVEAEPGGEKEGP